jgi:hypothetical protein
VLVASSASGIDRRCLPPPTDVRGKTHERLRDAGERWLGERRGWAAVEEQNGGIVAASALKIGVSEMVSGW